MMKKLLLVGTCLAVFGYVGLLFSGIAKEDTDRCQDQLKQNKSQRKACKQEALTIILPDQVVEVVIGDGSDKKLEKVQKLYDEKIENLETKIAVLENTVSTLLVQVKHLEEFEKIVNKVDLARLAYSLYASSLNNSSTSSPMMPPDCNSDSYQAAILQEYSCIPQDGSLGLESDDTSPSSQDYVSGESLVNQ